MEIRRDEKGAEIVVVPSFRSLLFERLQRYNISQETAETVLEELAITTSIFVHRQRKAEQAAISAAKRSGRVIYLEPGEASVEPPVSKKKLDEKKFITEL